eukprot:gb/GFBE01061386.1/.p1 GENE.gb/GFBE01061386.1/~~gb/GFBE01061386.1/.p1  ORF type:complete len:133 (+),score=36.67 gb/GFBE01061386.1/:1-399(+)
MALRFQKTKRGGAGLLLVAALLALLCNSLAFLAAPGAQAAETARWQRAAVQSSMAGAAAMYPLAALAEIDMEARYQPPEQEFNAGNTFIGITLVFLLFAFTAPLILSSISGRNKDIADAEERARIYDEDPRK